MFKTKIQGYNSLSSLSLYNRSFYLHLVVYKPVHMLRNQKVLEIALQFSVLLALSFLCDHTNNFSSVSIISPSFWVDLFLLSLIFMTYLLPPLNPPPPRGPPLPRPLPPRPPRGPPRPPRNPPLTPPLPLPLRGSSSTNRVSSGSDSGRMK